MELKIKEIKVGERRQPRHEWHNGRCYRPTAADYREYRGKTVVYFHPDGESVWDNIANRRRRPHLAYRELMPAVLEALGLPADTKYRWNIHAGCKMCPCSPGMVIQLNRCITPETAHERRRKVFKDCEGGKPYDVWVTITGEEHPADYDPAKIAGQVMGLEAVTL